MPTPLNIDNDIAKQLTQTANEKNQPATINDAINVSPDQTNKEKLLAIRGQVDMADNWQALRDLDKSE